MSNLNTIYNRILMAKQYENLITVESNTYIGIGRPVEWTGSDVIVPDTIESTNSIFEVYRNLVSIKKITGADTNLVTPRVDWANNTVYSEYTEDLYLFTYETKTELVGTVSTSVSSSNVIGTNTAFTANVSAGDFILIKGDGTSSYPKVKKEIVSITNNSFMVVNSAFNKAYTSNTIYKVTNSYPEFANKFYVRNNRDQVFKCLDNNGGAGSTIMPEIDVGGSLPENAYILTSDGYKWKYLYTIPAGLKEKFFTADWMPVVNENIVTASAVDGRLDIIKIYNGGSGYLSNGNSVSSNIISVIGDGTGANLTAEVANGAIVDINIISGGSNYTRATIAIDTTLGGGDANIISVISPPGGHGSDVEKELGATHLMICAELDGNEAGAFPTENLEEIFDYRQLALLRNVKDVDGLIADNTRYNVTYVLNVVPQSGVRIYLDDYVYQGDTYEDSTFRGVVAFWDEQNNKLWINNTDGVLISEGSPPLKTYSNGINPTTTVTITSVQEPQIETYSGEVLYVKNSEPILRDNDQLEQIKLVVSF
jgi:hypothetical protein